MSDIQSHMGSDGPAAGLLGRALAFFQGRPYPPSRVKEKGRGLDLPGQQQNGQGSDAVYRTHRKHQVAFSVPLGMTDQSGKGDLK